MHPATWYIVVMNKILLFITLTCSTIGTPGGSGQLAVQQLKNV